MAFDLTRSYFNDIRERVIADGYSVTDEGQLLMYTDAGDGTLAVMPCAGGAGENIAGFAITDALKYATQTMVEILTVPVGGGVVTLKQNNLVASTMHAYDTTNSNTLEEDGAAAAGKSWTLPVAGTIQFNAAEAGVSVTVTYRYTPTLDEALATSHERSINNRAQDYFSSVGVGCLDGEIFTTMYNTNSTTLYTIGAPILTESGGLVTATAGGTVVGFCTQLPSVSDGRLGVKYRF